MKTHRIAVALALLAATVTGCSGKTEPAKGQLMVALQTDMALPKDVDSVRVEVLSYGSTQFANTYQVGQGALLIPATLALVAGDDPARPVTIRVIALQQGKARMLREAITTVPHDRIATLRMPIQWLCDGSASEASPGQYASTCPDGQTCAGGRCTDKLVPVSTLPLFDATKIFGGGLGPGDKSGVCFDTEGCFGAKPLAEVNTSDCTVARPSGGEANVALVPKGKKDGICDSERCYVPLDRSETEGFREAGGKLELPARVCEQLKAGKLEGVVVTTGCATKTETTPPCGSWSSVNKAPLPPVAEACASYCEAQCDYAKRCDPQALARFGGSQVCATRCDLYCDNLLATPGVVPSVEAFEQVASALKNNACMPAESAIFGHVLFSPKGTLEAGAKCAFVEQCQSGVCKGGSYETCGACAVPLPDDIIPFSRKQGESCVSDVHCTPGLLCGPQEVCTQAQQQGAACSEQSPCIPGFSCVSSGGKATCQAPKAQENQPCAVSEEDPYVKQHPDCDPSKGLQCANGVCRKLPPVGQPCLAQMSSGGYGGSSSFERYCLDGYCSEQGDIPTCKPYLADGAACEDSDQCLWPSVCFQGRCGARTYSALCSSQGGNGGSGGSSGQGGGGGAGGAGQGGGGAGGAGGNSPCIECVQEKCSEQLSLCSQDPECTKAQICVLENCKGSYNPQTLLACGKEFCGLSGDYLPPTIGDVYYCASSQCVVECVGAGVGGNGGTGGGQGAGGGATIECLGNQTLCQTADGFYCASLEFDSKNCGECGKVCLEGQFCEASKCYGPE